MPYPELEVRVHDEFSVEACWDAALLAVFFESYVLADTGSSTEVNRSARTFRRANL